MANLAIIPARGGSKRIPKKNIKLFHNKPIIEYTITTLKNSNLFDEVMVKLWEQKFLFLEMKKAQMILQRYLRLYWKF